ncbi:MAG: hypothetical protein RL235_1004 [Chlamydiota bacterium]|jgi:hypothetical protein
MASATNTLNPLVTINPNNEVRFLNRKALSYNVLSKICWVALAAITVAVLAGCFILGSISGPLSFVWLGVALATPFLGIGASRLQGRANQYKSLAQIEKRVAAKYNALPQETRNRSVTARLQVIEELAKESFRRAHAIYRSAQSTHNQHLRGYQMTMVWHELETGFGMCCVQAAFLDYLSHNPSDQRALHAHGQFDFGSFTSRMANAVFDKTPGPLFVRQEAADQPPVPIVESGIIDSATRTFSHDQLTDDMISDGWRAGSQKAYQQFSAAARAGTRA